MKIILSGLIFLLPCFLTAAYALKGCNVKESPGAHVPRSGQVDTKKPAYPKAIYPLIEAIGTDTETTAIKIGKAEVKIAQINRCVEGNCKNIATNITHRNPAGKITTTLIVKGAPPVTSKSTGVELSNPTKILADIIRKQVDNTPECGQNSNNSNAKRQRALS